MGRKKSLRTMFGKWLSVLLATALLVGNVMGLTVHAKKNPQIQKFNVALVLDGSGSLVSNSNGTDNDGLRYEAIQLFLALLSDQGNEVSAIVFDDDSENYLLNTDVEQVSGKEEKLDLSQKIKDAGTGGDTDIGSALLTAVERLEAVNNDNESIIILFSDGRTDLGGDEKAYEQSLVNKDKAITKAQEDDIPIYSICLAASSVADPEELQEISVRTNGSSVTIDSPDKISQAFEQFYRLIFATSTTEAENAKFPESGILNEKIEIPSYGAEEINVILNSKSPDDVHVQAQAPSKAYTEKDLDANTIVAGNYKVVKVVRPEKGTWEFQIQGAPGNEVVLNVLYNVDVSAQLSTQGDVADLNSGDALTLQASLYKDENKIQDAAGISEYTGTLEITDLSTGKVVKSLPMEADADGFTCELEALPEGSYSFQAVLSCEGITVKTNVITAGWDNKAPGFANESKNKIKDGVKIIKKIVTPLTGRKYKATLSNFFADDQSDGLTYSIVNSQLVDGTVQLEGDKLTVNTAKSRSGDLVVRATDNQGAYRDLTLRFKVTNLTLAVFLLILAGIVIAAVLSFLGWRANRPLFNGQMIVSSAAPGSAALPRGSFRGKLSLQKFPVPGCGFDVKKCYFQTCRGGRLEFHAPGSFYINGIPYTKKCTLMPGQTVIYSDENQTSGIRVQIKMNY